MPSSHRRRAVAGLLSLAVAVAVLAVACTGRPGGPHHPPPTTGATTPTTIGGTVDCGRISYPSGWPTTRVVSLRTGPGKCLLDAWAAGTPARLATADQTDGQGGHLMHVTYEVLGPGRLLVTRDPRQTVAGGEVTTERCTELSVSGMYFQPGGCTGA